MTTTKTTPPSEPLLSFGPLESLIVAAKRVRDGGNPKLLDEPLGQLAELQRLRDTATAQHVIERARELHINSECDVDVENATIAYHNETDGWWVMGWLWVGESSLPRYEKRAEEEEFFAVRYRCPNCRHMWEEEWSCSCDSTCPACGLRDIMAIDAEGDHDDAS